MPLTPRHALNILTVVLLMYEKRVDEVGGGYEVFFYHGADGLGFAVAAGAGSLADPDAGGVVGNEGGFGAGGGGEVEVGVVGLHGFEGEGEGGGRGQEGEAGRR